MVFEQSPSVVMVALLTLLRGSSSPSKTRGVISLGLGYLSLILMDSDATVEADHSEFHFFIQKKRHIFRVFFALFGMSSWLSTSSSSAEF